MADNLVPLLDRLRDRGLVDRYGFILFAGLGGIGIFLLKLIGVHAGWVALAAAIAMVGYAALADLKGSGRLRGDQAGDNCYYLGLIYTLVSLAHAILTFDPNDTATTIVQGFGIALLTTILGLILRVFFNQSRVDLYETEDTARLELADAAGRLKTELLQITSSMSDFALQTRQAVEEMRDAAVAQLASTLEKSVETIDGVTARAREAADTQANEAIARTKQLNSATNRVTQALERHGETLERVGGTSEAIATSLAAIEAAANQTRDSISAVQEQMKLSAEQNSQIAAQAAQVLDAARQLDSVVSQVSATLLKVRADALRQLEETRVSPKQAVDDAVAAINAVVDEFKSATSSLLDERKSEAKALTIELANAVAGVRDHNQALEQELAKSRGNVAKVHDNLVTMTGQLIEQVRLSA
jgi:hypothetical protein